MIVLGIHMGHDSSAAIIKNGEILADVQEERFTRVKHSADVPINAIMYCLETCGLDDINQVDYVSYSWRKTDKRFAAVMGIESVVNYNSRTDELLKLKNRVLGRKDMTLTMPIYLPNLKLDNPKKFVNNEHHLIHAASAYYTRKSNDKCLIFTVDGAGDGVSTAVWMGEGNEIKPLQKYNGMEAGIGWAYSVVTEGLHWIHGDGEGKTMGLAPYGDYNNCKGVLDKYFPKFDGAELVKKSQLTRGGVWVQRGSNQFHFEEAKEIEELVKKYGREDIAAEAQRKLEECLLNFMLGWCKKTGIKKVCSAGGVYLNVKLNQRIWENRGDTIEEYHVYPNPADCGLAVGAALNEYYKHNEFKGMSMDHLYLGPEYSNDQILELLKIRKLNYEYLENPSKTAAKLLSQNKIVAWFQGRMESGPRALGNRSILMSPIHPDNKNTINAYVKFREGFRPFCPSLLHEKSDMYLKDYKEELFMITSYSVTDEKRDKIPAVVHHDGTLRPQMVRKDLNPRYWELINEFGNITGEYIVLNTSFNVMGEPIISHPKEAIKCFFDSGLDALIIGNYLLKKYDFTDN